MRNNFVQDKEYDSEAEDVEEDDQLSFSGLDMGPCPFCNNQIKRYRIVWAKWLIGKVVASNTRSNLVIAKVLYRTSIYC